jgi:hypothetical protein
MKRFAIRKVRNGRVKIGNRYFAPDLPAPQLEGQWLAFGRYYVAGRELDYVCLWGTKATYVAAGQGDEAYEACWNAQLPLITANGYHIWEWWKALT